MFLARASLPCAGRLVCDGRSRQSPPRGGMNAASVRQALGEAALVVLILLPASEQSGMSTHETILE